LHGRTPALRVVPAIAEYRNFPCLPGALMATQPLATLAFSLHQESQMNFFGGAVTYYGLFKSRLVFYLH
jgi:hypothetical protein